MKFILTSDLHLGAKIKRLSTEKGKAIREEELLQIGELFSYARKNDCEAIFIPGDLFDGKAYSQKFQKAFFDFVKESKVKTFYLRGNHDEEFSLQSLPENFYVFDDVYRLYDFDGYTVSGQQSGELITPIFSNNKFHFHLLHGDIFNCNSKDGIDLNAMKNCGIDALLLGHLHYYNTGKLDEKGEYIYSGCLFSHGFDECGEKGFVELTLENGELKQKFISFAKRRFEIVKVDISGLEKFSEIKSKISNEVKLINQNNLLRVLLTGFISEDCEKFIDQLKSVFAKNFYYFELVDESKLKLDFDKLKNESLSFKSEFLSLVASSNLSEEEKNLVSQIGIEALRGDELSI